MSPLGTGTGHQGLTRQSTTRLCLCRISRYSDLLLHIHPSWQFSIFL